MKRVSEKERKKSGCVDDGRVCTDEKEQKRPAFKLEMRRWAK